MRGKRNARLPCEMALHKDFRRTMVDIEIFADRIADIHVRPVECRIIPQFLQTIPLGIYRKERNINESNRHRSPGRRSGKNRHPEGNKKNPSYQRGRPVADIIDTVGEILFFYVGFG